MTHIFSAAMIPRRDICFSLFFQKDYLVITSTYFCVVANLIWYLEVMQQQKLIITHHAFKNAVIITTAAVIMTAREYYINNWRAS